MSRHPYTHAADLVRAWAGYSAQGTKLSRSDASVIRQGFAEVLGMDDEQLACRLSEYFQAHEDEIARRGVEAMGLALLAHTAPLESEDRP